MADFSDFEPDPYADLPSNPEEAFLQLERHYKQQLDGELKRASEQERVDIYFTHYIAKVIAAIVELDLESEVTKQKVPVVEDVDYSTYLNFAKDVEHYKTRLRIRHALRRQGYSVKFDAVAKQKIHHHLAQLRELFDKLEVEEEKRESLFSRLNELEQEVDRNRTHFDSLAALTIEAAAIMGEAVEKSKIRDLIDSIARIFWGAQQDDATKRLPGPVAPKKLEPPRAASTSSEERPDLDDKIPF